MTEKKKKLPADFVIDEALANTLQQAQKDGKLSCAGAFAVAKATGAPPLQVGQTANALEIRLTHCQLGLFGYPDGKGWQRSKVTEAPVPEGLEEAIRAALENEALPCASAWAIAKQFNLPKMQVSYIADQMGIRITPCQLGVF